MQAQNKNKVQVQATSTGQVNIKEIKGDGGALPLDPDKNTSGVVIKMFLEDLGSGQGVDIYLEKKIFERNENFKYCIKILSLNYQYKNSKTKNKK